MDSLITNGPCPMEGCGSSDAYCEQVNDAGETWGHCFSCDRNVPVGEGGAAPKPLAPTRPGLTHDLDFRPITTRGLTAATCRKYGYGIDPDGNQVAQWRDAAGTVVGQKLRGPGKKFWVQGSVTNAGLFGQHLFKQGGRRVYITEGEIDAMSVSQLFGNRWPVVSLTAGSDKAGRGPARELAAELEWLLSYEEIVLVFDQDEAGHAAVATCCEVIGPGRVKIASLPRKDANEMLVAGELDELKSALYEARLWMPDGIIHGIDMIKEMLTPPQPGLSYPWPCFDHILHGQHKAEMILHAAGSGIGKTQVLKEIINHDHKEHGQKIGVICLEEARAHAARCQLGIDLNLPLHLPGEFEKVDTALLEETARVRLDGMYFTNTVLSEEAVITQMRYLAQAFGCTVIVLDHISMVVGTDGASKTDERTRIDSLMYAMGKLRDELGLTIHVISHLKKKSDGKPHEEGGRVTMADARGAGTLYQVPNTFIGYERNNQDPDDERARTITVRVLKNRLTGETGVAGGLIYDRATARLSEVELPDPAEAKGPGFKPAGGPRKGEF